MSIRFNFGGDEHRSQMEASAKIVEAQRPRSAQDEERNREAGAELKLPFSRARAIALVATVTSASFLNVSGFLLYGVGVEC